MPRSYSTHCDLEQGRFVFRLMSLAIAFAVVFCCVSQPVACAANAPALLELKTAQSTYQGKLVVNDKNVCWLMGADGRLSEVKLNQVSNYRTVAPRFQHLNSVQMRDQISRELNKKYETVSKGSYVVAARRGQASEYATLFDNIARRFYSYFSVRRIPVTKPAVPLVAIVFDNQAEFAAYCQRDGFRASPGLGGYYLPTSNRVALFNAQGRANAQGSGGKVSASDPSQQNHWDEQFDMQRTDMLPATKQFGLPQVPVNGIHGRLSGNTTLRDTIIHEATHQIAFNMGLHSRIGENPKWIVEGLAMVFEAEGVRNGNRTGSAAQRINPERLAWFTNFANKWRPRRSLALHVASDQLFQRSALDAYSEAWALTFYLLETRHRDYFRYLAKVAQREPFGRYSSKERLADFAEFFGKDFDRLEASMLRFMDNLSHDAKP